jgi:hypothetical protein
MEVALISAAVLLAFAGVILLVGRLASARSRRSALHFAGSVGESGARCVDCGVKLGPTLQVELCLRPDSPVWRVVCPSCGKDLFFSAGLQDVTVAERTARALTLRTSSHGGKDASMLDRWPRLTLAGLAILTFLVVASLTWVCRTRL